jgi:hypothetical protein
VVDCPLDRFWFSAGTWKLGLLDLPWYFGGAVPGMMVDDVLVLVLV